jgi:hypothetical protein
MKKYLATAVLMCATNWTVTTIAASSQIPVNVKDDEEFDFPEHIRINAQTPSDIEFAVNLAMRTLKTSWRAISSKIYEEEYLNIYDNTVEAFYRIAKRLEPSSDIRYFFLNHAPACTHSQGRKPPIIKDKTTGTPIANPDATSRDFLTEFESNALGMIDELKKISGPNPYEKLRFNIEYYKHDLPSAVAVSRFLQQRMSKELHTFSNRTFAQLCSARYSFMEDLKELIPLINTLKLSCFESVNSAYTAVLENETQIKKNPWWSKIPVSNYFGPDIDVRMGENAESTIALLGEDIESRIKQGREKTELTVEQVKNTLSLFSKRKELLARLSSAFDLLNQELEQYDDKGGL